MCCFEIRINHFPQVLDTPVIVVTYFSQLLHNNGRKKNNLKFDDNMIKAEGSILKELSIRIYRHESFM